MVSVDQLSNLIGALYSAAEKPELWPQFLAGLRDAIKSETAVLVVADWQDAAASVSVSVGFGAETIHAYDRQWGRKDVWLTTGSELMRSPGAVYASQQLVPDAAVEKSEFYNEFLRPLGLSQAMCATIAAGDQTTAILTCNYAKRAGHRTTNQFQIVELLVPHLRKAIQIHRQLRGSVLSGRAMEEALDRQLVAFIMLDMRGCPRRMNREAERILAERDGLSILGGHVVAGLPAENGVLRDLIRQASLTTQGRNLESDGVLRVSRPSGKTPYSLLVSPVSVTGDLLERHKTLAVMLIADPDRLPKGAAATLTKLFGFTRAEAKVALALMNGQRTSDIAAKLYISQNTLRTHLKRLYAKAGVPGQAGLARLLHRSLFDGPEETPSDSRSRSINRVKSGRPGNRSIP